LELRLLKRGDIPTLIEICRLGMEFDNWYDDLLIQKTVGAKDYDPELGIVAEEDSEVAGFVQGVFGMRQDVPWGWVRLLVVHPKWRCRGIGSALLSEIEKRLVARGAEKISIMDVYGNYQMPGVDVRYKEAFCFLEKYGYERGMPNINLICDVSPERFDCDGDIERLKTEGFIIRRAEQSDWEGVEKFLAANWRSWITEVHSCYDNEPVTLYICIKDSEVVGFSAYEGNNKKMGWFGPMGVLPVTRGKGIGGILCKLCLRDIALAGHRRAIIPWVGPVRFYDKVCGSKIDRVFWTFTKDVRRNKSTSGG